MQKITPFLWFNDNAEEAINFYTSIFKDSKITSLSRRPDNVPGKGSLLVGSFTLNGQEFIAMNGGPNHPFTDAISLTINCETQEEVDHYWQKLTADGGKEIMCGWLKDKYGLSWQVTPTLIGKLMSKATPEQSARVMGAVMSMIKLDIAGLQKAFDGE